MGDTRSPVEIMKITFQYVDRIHPLKISIELLKNGKPMESQESDHQPVDANVTINWKTENASEVEHETSRVDPKPTNSSGEF